MPRVEVVAQTITQKVEAQQDARQQTGRNQQRPGGSLHLLDAGIHEGDIVVVRRQSTAENGDVFDKAVVRILELFESIRIVEQCVGQLETVRGPIDSNPPNVPPGEGIGHYEAPRGEVFHYVRSDGGNRPVRHKVRAPSYMNVPTNCVTVPGGTVADIGSGTGYFARRFATAVGPADTVYAADVEPGMAEYVRRRADEDGQRNLVPVLASRFLRLPSAEGGAGSPSGGRHTRRTPSAVGSTASSRGVLDGGGGRGGPQQHEQPEDRGGEELGLLSCVDVAAEMACVVRVGERGAKGSGQAFEVVLNEAGAARVAGPEFDRGVAQQAPTPPRRALGGEGIELEQRADPQPFEHRLGVPTR